MKINSKKYYLAIITLSGLLSFYMPAQADWQSDLEAKFNIVETFDPLQNWRGVDNLRAKKADGYASYDN